jgi:hypothetical protein
VLLPQPLGPVTAQKEQGSISNDTSRKACTSPAGEG